MDVTVLGLPVCSGSFSLKNSIRLNREGIFSKEHEEKQCTPTANSMPSGWHFQTAGICTGWFSLLNWLSFRIFDNFISTISYWIDQNWSELTWQRTAFWPGTTEGFLFVDADFVSRIQIDFIKMQFKKGGTRFDWNYHCRTRYHKYKSPLASSILQSGHEENCSPCQSGEVIWRSAQIHWDPPKTESLPSFRQVLPLTLHGLLHFAIHMVHAGTFHLEI